MDEDALLRAAPFRGVMRVPSPRVSSLGSIVFAHGFGVPPRAYSALASLWARDGWSVYIPALYSVLVPAGDELPALASAASFAYNELPPPILLAGHSRGGQAALMLLLRLMGGAFGDELGACDHAPPLDAFRGLLLLDPVEGRPRAFGAGLQHLILGAAGLDWGWTDLPVLIVGARRGGDGCTPGAPVGHNYAAIYSGLRAATAITTGSAEFGAMPFFLCEVSRFGHMDFLDDASLANGCIPALAWCFLPGEAAERAALREYCRKVTKMVFGVGCKLDLPARLSRVKPVRMVQRSPEA